MTPAPIDLPQAHRYFAVEFNNLGWQLVEDPSRDAAGTERMIHAAHAACLHWLNAGNALNHQRAQCLLATAYAKAGLGEAAVRHAERCRALSAENGDAQTIFDRATAHGCAAIAFGVAGNDQAAKVEQHVAAEFAARFEDSDDRVVFDRLYGNA
jgi:hypothetical protein